MAVCGTRGSELRAREVEETDPKFDATLLPDRGYFELGEGNGDIDISLEAHVQKYMIV